MFRIQQAGPNASGQTHYLSLSGFEMYGSINGVADEPPGRYMFINVSTALKAYKNTSIFLYHYCVHRIRHL